MVRNVIAKPVLVWLSILVACLSGTVAAQLVDKNKAPNLANEGITRPLMGGPYPSLIGEGRAGADWNASANVIACDPFRAIRRGRQLFPRKFAGLEGLGPITNDGFGDINTDGSIGAGFADNCAACHGRPRGSAGFGGDVATRPDSRDAPHLFGLGLKEMLADEITTDLRAIRAAAKDRAKRLGIAVVRSLVSRGIGYGAIRALPDGTFDTTGEPSAEARQGRRLMQEIGCTVCHVPSLGIKRDRRVAEVETVFNPAQGHFNRLFATANLRLANPSSVGQAEVAKVPAMQPFAVQNIFTDFKRHDLGPNFHERNYDGTIRTHFLTTPLWGVGSTSPVRPRWSQHQPGRGDPPARRRGSGRAERLLGARSGQSPCGGEISRVVDSLSPRRHRIESGSGRSGGSRVPSVQARKYPADGAVQRSVHGGVATGRVTAELAAASLSATSSCAPCPAWRDPGGRSVAPFDGTKQVELGERLPGTSESLTVRR